MRTFSFSCLCLLSVLALSWGLPQLYDMALLRPLERTHIFYSPILKRCVYTEQIRGHDVQAAEKSEGHHADIVYKDELGMYYDRVAFEAALPFIYYRNMELRGLLPLRLEGRTLDRKAIERSRRVLELPARHLDGHRPSHPCLPLVESEPGQAALLYPADRFRLTLQSMEFIHADTNEVEPELTRLFTEALSQAGFVFPARHVGGNFTTFKPYEGGLFLVDAGGGLFQLLRRGGKPVVRKVPLPQDVEPRHVLVSESRERLWLGLVLDAQDRLWLLRQQDLALIGLSMPAYDPGSMDCKLVFDPLYLTVVMSDETEAHVAVFDLPSAERKNGDICQPFHSFSHTMSRALESWQSRLSDTIFPYRIELAEENSSLMTPRFVLSRHLFSHALPFSLFLACSFILARMRRQTGRKCSTELLASAGFILLTGLYGAVSLLVLKQRR